MRILIACERSGKIRDAFRRRGHDAWSCDLAASETETAFHIQGDVLKHLAGWDAIIAHPTCTRLANSGVLRLYRDGKKINGFDLDKLAEMAEGASFFAALWCAPCAKVCVENPIIHCHAKLEIQDCIRILHDGNPPLPKPQIIQPFQFGHPESKATCLWLRGLPGLIPTSILPMPECGYWENQTPSGQNKLAPSKHRALDRARTYDGIAEAMAEQWGTTQGTGNALKSIISTHYKTDLFLQ